MRGWVSDGTTKPVSANLTSAESSVVWLNVNSTGFSHSSAVIGSGTYIYIAIRRGPMKTPEDATTVFAASLGAATTPAFTSNFPLDLAITSYRSGGGGNHYFVDRVRGQTALESPSNAAEGSVSSLWKLDQQTGFAQSSGSWDSTHVCNMFRRAPGFFDVVAYTGDGAFGRQIPHNLGSVPECIIYKRRDSTGDWFVYHTALGTDHTFLNASLGSNGTNYMVAPTSTVFEIGLLFSSLNNSGATFIAYLFATCPGVSKVGSYTGTGTTLNIDCGFTAGARFVMIKRTDSSGDWYVWDTARGIVSGNDPYLLLNSTAAEVTSTDYIDPLSSGFQISSTAPAAINANGGSFIFLAIA